jgi:hypothetical protein
MSSDELKETAGTAPRAGNWSGIELNTDELYCERVIAAREMPPEEKLLAGEELFEYACSITLAGIHDQFPKASDDECREILIKRLELRDRAEQCT